MRVSERWKYFLNIKLWPPSIGPDRSPCCAGAVGSLLRCPGCCFTSVVPLSSSAAPVGFFLVCLLCFSSLPPGIFYFSLAIWLLSVSLSDVLVPSCQLFLSGSLLTHWIPPFLTIGDDDKCLKRLLSILLFCFLPLFFHTFIVGIDLWIRRKGS